MAAVEFALVDERPEAAKCVPLQRCVVLLNDAAAAPPLNKVLSGVAASGVTVNRVTGTQSVVALTAPKNAPCFHNALKRIWALSPCTQDGFQMPGIGEVSLDRMVVRCDAMLEPRHRHNPDIEERCGANLSVANIFADFARKEAYGRALRPVCRECAERW